MKKIIIVNILLGLTQLGVAQSTIQIEDMPHSKMEFVITPKLGFAKVSQTGSPSMSGFVNGGDFLYSLKIKKWNLLFGAGYYQFDANTTLNGNPMSLRNSYLQLPLKLKRDCVIFKDKSQTQNTYLTVGFGAYANDLLKQEMQSSSVTDKAHNLGWNFGFVSQLGVKFKMSDIINLELGFESQSDFSKMKKNGVENKIQNLNVLFFSINYKV